MKKYLFLLYPCFAFGLWMCTPDLHAQIPELVKDIRLQTEDSRPSHLLEFQGNLFFQAYSSLSAGTELWRTDGTAMGTQLFKDLWPGPQQSIPRDLTIYQGMMYFSAQDSAHGRELWLSDGTASGTQLFLDLEAGPASMNPHGLFSAIDFLFFTGRQTSIPNQEGVSLWRTDGTLEGTFPLAIIDSFENFVDPVHFISVANMLYFTAGLNSSELWKTDGTGVGTALVKKFDQGISGESEISEMTAFGGNLFFVVETAESGSEIWQSDGTESGTQLFLDMKPGVEGSNPHSLTVWGDSLFFTANGVGGMGAELWKTSTNPQDISLVKDIYAGPNSSNPSHLYLWKNSLYFAATNVGEGMELWTSDGTSAGTMLLKDLDLNGSGGPYQFFADTSLLYFSARNDTSGWELWRTDGTEVGTMLLKDIYPGYHSSYVSEFTSFQGKLWFQAETHEEGAELWSTDGSPDQTSLLTDIRTETEGSWPDHMISLNNQLLFVANDGISGAELWRSDGSGAGTHLLKDIWPEEPNSNYRLFTAADSLVFFTATRPEDGKTSGELWKSNGTEAGTQVVKEIVSGAGGPGIQEMVWFQDRLFFIAEDGQSGQEIWVSDGTESGTELFLDIKAGSEDSYPNDLIIWGNQLFFIAKGAGLKNALYVNDGTKGGTVMLKEDIGFGNIVGTSDAYLFFQAPKDSVSGVELWRTDGTLAGTQLVKDIYPGVGASHPFQGVGFGQELIFIAIHPDYGRELWISDGTEHGTRLLKEFWPGNETGLPPFPNQFTPLGDILIFVGNDSIHGTELWRTDGTPSGTKRIRDIVPGPQKTAMKILGIWQDRVLVSAWTESDGQELWITDGNWQGTFQLWSFHPGMSSTSFGSMTVLGSDAYLSVSTSAFGQELWRLPATIIGVENELEPVQKIDLQAFPNPVKDLLHINIKRPKPQMAELSLFSLDGRRIYRQIIGQEEALDLDKNLDIHMLPVGIYLLQYQTAGTRTSLKIVKQ
ncbi:MAG: ELWxxDGT repeat protein [Bacteroidota bacterium]